MATVTFNGTRIEDAEASTGWTNLVGGGPAPAAEPQLKYQANNAVNRKVNSTSDRRGVQYTHTATTDMTSASFPLWLAKVKVGDAADVNTTYGVELGIGSAAAASYRYNVSGSGANNDQYTAGYNSQGGLAEGYLITAINPNISQWRESTSGSPALGAVDWFGFAAQFVTGGAKSENVAMDAIDLGVGLDYNGTSFTFDDGADTDQDVVANRWGFACRNGSVLTFRGMHRVGPTSSTSGSDTSTVLFPDGYHGTGDCGITYTTTNATATLDGTYTGLGRIYGADDTRPDLVFDGDDTNSSTHTGTFNNFRAGILRTSITLSSAFLQCADLTQAGGTLVDSTISCDAASGVAVCNDFTPSDVSNVTFVQSGAGHAIEITTPGTYSFSSLFFGGFGADGTNSAAIYNNSGGLVTINVTGNGDTPTVRNGTGASTTINNAVTITLSDLVAGSRVYVSNTTDSVVLFNTVEPTTTFTDSVNYTGDKTLDIRVRNASGVTKYKPFQAAGTLTANGFSLIVNQVPDE